ncbi:RsmB/NOP family class I SAM-dependent RNA methyltransferase [Coraliomargarita parva]|uniref:RsmB/NOP family class I SAM-dependent RNA methyltransferase n=1 Tax=Coraliomargarita parva TaxID=3014050 RepID=UPI0022B56B4E|nr:RsmB/NOP family class I SAM-dependent RNA methyltransferase [Coraliomargarita parva]
MRSVKFALSSKNATAWGAAVLLTSAYLAENKKANQLLAELPDSFVGERRAVCQSLFLGALRHGFRVRAALNPFVRRAPRPELEAVLLVAGYELLDAPEEKAPKIIHHAVEQAKALAKASESGFLNALLRKLPAALEAQSPEKSAAAYYSHPAWLVSHWEAVFGADACKALLEWNQGIPDTYLRIYDPADVPEGLEATEWPGFFRIRSAELHSDAVQALLAEGRAYIKDPSTRRATALLAPQPGECVLDLCASPGGKAFDLAHRMQGEGCLVAVDLPGKRIERLEENLNKLRSEKLQATILPSDVLELSKEAFAEQALPDSYDAVMLDAPCSNTGVIQRRTDVKWRLAPKDIPACAKLQQQLIHSAARFVKPGGKFVYSTCSIEPEENQVLIDAFLKSKSGQAFQLLESVHCLPWECRHDGATAFLLQRSL